MPQSNTLFFYLFLLDRKDTYKPTSKMINSVMWVAVISCAFTGALVSGATLQTVAVIHRHGARAPVPTVNTSALCPGGSAGCGVLTLQGKEMLNNLGKYLRAHYNETIQPCSFYNPDVVHTQSTDVDRTIQSAGALLRGLYMHLDNTPERVYPVVNTRDVERETELLVWDGWPALVMWSAATNAEFFPMVSQDILQNVLNATALAAIGQEIGLTEECDSTLPTFFPFQCAIDAEDMYSCAITTGTTDKYPVTGHFYPQLVEALVTYNVYAMGKFDEVTNGGAFLKAVGSFGFPLAEALVSHLADGSRSLTHYSGHDITLIPLYNALGNFTMLNPRFGAAMIFESWVDTNEDGATSTFVVASLGNLGSRRSPTSHTHSATSRLRACQALVCSISRPQAVPSKTFSATSRRVHHRAQWECATRATRPRQSSTVPQATWRLRRPTAVTTVACALTRAALMVQ